jgi:hypothetical protein
VGPALCRIDLLGRLVDAGDLRAASGHGQGRRARTGAHVQDVGAGERDMSLQPVEERLGQPGPVLGVVVALSSEVDL